MFVSGLLNIDITNVCDWFVELLMFVSGLLNIDITNVCEWFIEY